MDIKVTGERLRAVVQNLKQELQTLRSNRPSPKMVEDIKVEYYGQFTPINQLGSISVVPPREIDIQVWDTNAVSAIAKAIEASSLNVPANTTGNLIRINLPQLTDERKQALEKVVRKVVEESRIRVRGVREDANKEIRKAEEEKKLSEDAAFKEKEAVQKAVDGVNAEIEKLLEDKIHEIFD